MSKSFDERLANTIAFFTAQVMLPDDDRQMMRLRSEAEQTFPGKKVSVSGTQSRRWFWVTVDGISVVDCKGAKAFDAAEAALAVMGP